MIKAEISDKILLMVYGANGYSAELIISELLNRGVSPILAGRNYKSISATAKKYDCEFRVFDLSNIKIIDINLEGIHTLLNCAGPFQQTADILMDSCLRKKVNYLDITGEISVFESAWKRNESAKKYGIAILPGAGFDVIPTDCISMLLKEEMNDAHSLQLAFANRKGKISRGTLKTTINQFGKNALIREEGKLKEIKTGTDFKKINFGDFNKECMAIQWGDVFNAYYSTSIPNIKVYAAIPKILKFFVRLDIFKKFFFAAVIKNLLILLVERFITGPNVRERQKATTYIWGQVYNSNDEYVEHVFKFPDGYTLTKKGAAECAIRLLNNALKPGTYTPSTAFGSNFIDLFVIDKIR